MTDHYRAVFADILSQAVTGELIGMQNFASLAALCDNVDEKSEAVEHANTELSHALAFREAAAELGVCLMEDLKAPYWQRIREAFLKWAERRDLVACTLIRSNIAACAAAGASRIRCIMSSLTWQRSAAGPSTSI